MAIREILYNHHNYCISYEILNQSKSKSIVFLHGWGSNKEIMKKAFSNELSEYKHIYVDLPGFGSSSIHEPLRTEDYAKIMKLFFESLHVQPLIVLGHSFGGKVSSLLNPQNLVLLSSAGIVVEKSLKVKCKIKLAKILKMIGLQGINKVLASKDVENMSQMMYDVFKNVVDEDFSLVFENLNSRTLLFWGKYDSATPLKSGEKMASLIQNSKFYPLEGDHFFFMKNAHLICEVIENEQL